MPDIRQANRWCLKFFSANATGNNPAKFSGTDEEAMWALLMYFANEGNSSPSQLQGSTRIEIRGDHQAVQNFSENVVTKEL